MTGARGRSHGHLHKTGPQLSLPSNLEMCLFIVYREALCVLLAAPDWGILVVVESIVNNTALSTNFSGLLVVRPR